ANSSGPMPCCHHRVLSAANTSRGVGSVANGENVHTSSMAPNQATRMMSAVHGSTTRLGKTARASAARHPGASGAPGTVVVMVGPAIGALADLRSIVGGGAQNDFDAAVLGATFRAGVRRDGLAHPMREYLDAPLREVGRGLPLQPLLDRKR